MSCNCKGNKYIVETRKVFGEREPRKRDIPLKEKSIVIWDDGDPVNADKSYYISGNGYDTSYKWQLTFDNPDNVYNVNINCIDNGIVKQIPAERIGSSDIFETGKISRIWHL